MIRDGDDLNSVPTDKATHAVKRLCQCFCLAMPVNIPASKAGSVAHFEAEILTRQYPSL
jgi:sulfide:quinone oxidoreductase